MPNENTNKNNKKDNLVAVRSVKLTGTSVKYYENNRKPEQVHLYDESELLRIVKSLEKQLGEKHDKFNNLPVVWGVVFVDATNTKAYEAVMNNGGVLKLEHYRFQKIRDEAPAEDGNSGKKKKPKYHTETVCMDETESFKRLMCGSSHSRKKKAVFIREDLYDAVNEILRCGIDSPAKYVNKDKDTKKNLAKWNAYFALASTGSKKVTTPEEIIVVKDFRRGIKTTCDVVTMDKTAEKVTYSLYSNQADYPINSNCFDGAGLVSVAMAKQWAKDLGVLDKEEEGYIPASFQIRAIPGIKGNVYTFDIAKFAEEKNDGKYIIVDINGNEIEFGKDDKVVILTESQVKFLSMFENIDAWREEFDREVEVTVNGRTLKYQRTFNISEYSIPLEEVKRNRFTAYQHLQTLDIFGDDAKNLVSKTMRKISIISNSLSEFLKFRNALDNTDSDNDEADDYLPPYYKAAGKYLRKLEEQGADKAEINKRLEKCFADNYFREKMEADIEGRKEGARSGRLLVTGNYQVFTPDLYALCQHAFGFEEKDVTGLLKGDEIYSAWWLASEKKEKTKIKELAITRNPQIYMESRIVNLAHGKELDSWFEYQKTGILISSYSHVPYALGTADFDGDTVATTNNTVFINAIRTAIEEGSGNTIYLEDKGNAVKNPDCVLSKKLKSKKDAAQITDPNDIKSLMASDLIAFKNNIGEVVNLITKIWNFNARNDLGVRALTEEEDAAFHAEKQSYLKIMSVIGQLTLDAAKTGDEVVIPKDVENFIKKYSEKYEDKMPEFMRHTKKHIDIDKVKGRSFLAPTTMEQIGREVVIALNEERNELTEYIKNEYEVMGFLYSFDYDENCKKLREEYEKLRNSGYLDEEMALSKFVKAIMAHNTEKMFDLEEFMKISCVIPVDKQGALYKAAAEALKTAYINHSAFSNDMEEKDVTAEEKRNQYAIFYRITKAALISLCVKDKNGKTLRERFSEDELKKITADELLDCYIIAAYENKSATKAPKDVLWNCFGDKIVGRIENGREADPKRLAEFMPIKEPLEWEPTPRGDGKTPFDKLNASVTFYQNELDFIVETVRKTFKGKPMQKKMMRFCAVFAVITKARDNNSKQKGFSIEELTKDKTVFAREYMLVKGTDNTCRRKLDGLDEIFEQLLKCGILIGKSERYRAELPKPDGEVVFEDKPFKEACGLAVQEILKMLLEKNKKCSKRHIKGGNLKERKK